MLIFFIILLSCQLAGEVIVIAAGLPLPGPVVGMVLLLTGLLIKGRIPQGLDRMADALLSHLSLLFVPAGVGVILHVQLIGAELLPIAASIIVSTMLTIAVTALLMQWLGGRGARE
jgi:putative effector of murein hydrolase LrgA (UPF0299 family)